MNKNWDRWIFASISKYFDDRRDGIPLYPEGMNRPINIDQDYAELRMTGPSYYKVGPVTYRADITVNVLINAIRTDDNHRMFRLAGTIETAFGRQIPIYKYGDGPDDNPAILIGCLLIQEDGGRDIETNHYGQLAPDLNILQSTIEASYRTLLEEVPV